MPKSQGTTDAASVPAHSARHDDPSTEFIGALQNYLNELNNSPPDRIWSFVEFQFPPHVTFPDSSVLGLSDFTGATFYGDAQFANVTFSRCVYFHHVRIKGDGIFSRAQFVERMSFTDVEIVGVADFHAATFCDGTHFERVQFQGESLFNNCTFINTAYFIDASFGIESHYKASERSDSPVTTFSKSTFSLPRRLASRHSSNVVFFHSIYFSGNTDFSGANFSGSPRSIKASRHDQSERAEHAETESDEANLHIGQVNFLGSTDFSQSVFGSRSEFINTTFHGMVSFSRAHVEKDFTIHNDSNNPTFKASCDFSSVRTDREVEVTFTRVNLANTSFRGTDVERFAFRDITWRRVQWPTPGTWYWPTWHRYAICDEFNRFKDDSLPDYAAAQQTYHQLILNYEARRDFELAEDFYIGEMEVRRKATNNPMNFHTAYAMLSRYGASYRHAFAVLSLFFIVFSILFMHVGFQSSSTDGAISMERVKYDIPLIFGWRHDALCPWDEAVLRDFRRSLAFTLSIVTFQRDRFYVPIDEYGQILLNVAVIALVGQSALLVLAIRRRFRRSK
ncbi:MAG: pentapeptide repeat-containing protein [Chloroflexota bacterium]